MAVLLKQETYEQLPQLLDILMLQHPSSAKREETSDLLKQQEILLTLENATEIISIY